MPPARALLLLLAFASLGSRCSLQVIAGGEASPRCYSFSMRAGRKGGTFVVPIRLVSDQDCPLDFSWSNFSLASSTCSDQNQRGECCRYISAFVAISIARYANATGRLGVPAAFTEVCLNFIAESFKLYGIPANALSSCGLGPKIQVSYQCEGRATVLEIMQSPNFSDVIETCNEPLSLDNSCKRCLNSGIVYLHHLIAVDDNVTLSVCRDAVFVTLANQGDNFSAVDLVTCFFGVQGLSILSAISSGSRTPTSSPSSVSSSSVSAEAPKQQLLTGPVNKNWHSYHLTLLPGIGIAVIGLSILLILILILLIRQKSRKLKNSDSQMSSWNAFPPAQVHRSQEGPSNMFGKFTYKEIKKATENFSTVIGKGGFGTVYKAQFADGSITAVKRMNKISKQGEEEFCREIELLARLHHRHLVALKGFCAERNERFLIYEYMENGSLKDHLHSPGKNRLSWSTRLKIAVDVANALEYLHFYCDPPLCHRDIKSSNILLDEKLVAKVADFGLAHASRNGAISFEPVNTDICGTPGYMDPEYVVTQELTQKSDIYSYGVLLLELVTGRRAIQNDRNLIEWSQKFMASVSTITGLVDPAIEDSFEFEQLQMLVEIIQSCTNKQGRDRPSIKQVLRVFSEHLDPVQNVFSADDPATGKTSIPTMHKNEVIPNSGDAKLQSSSSTSRSYCSRSVLLESSSPQSPSGLLSV
ncbi:putative receptor-like protein kinase At1g49730 [Curcuma longa]|uniref:putative receptor-like protein kinase At1g49730 n=1 Tax=Curcuma longa TaxID=136217 RepID=UPI003D9F5213